MLHAHTQEEIKHYDALADVWSTTGALSKERESDVHGVHHDDYSSYAFFEELLKKYSQNCRVLDFGCGNGIHSLTPLRFGAREVIGIDLSQKSLDIAKIRAQKQGRADKVQFLLMNAEELEFPDNSFDIVIDGGTFSSLRLDVALKEIARILKPEGTVIGIETLGHNPLTNIKRVWNVARGTRTKWAADHIFKMRDFILAKKYFENVQARFFHLLILPFLAFRKIPGMPLIIKTAETVDEKLLKIPLLKRYAFKTVFVFSHPKKL